MALCTAKSHDTKYRFRMMKSNEMNVFDSTWRSGFRRRRARAPGAEPAQPPVSEQCQQDNDYAVLGFVRFFFEQRRSVPSSDIRRAASDNLYRIPFRHFPMKTSIACALLAAALFGASTPFAKLLAGQAAPIMLAALLYFGSGVGLSACRLLRSRKRDSGAPIARPDLPWLAGAVVSGGVLGPVLLMTGLTLVPASSASLLLNMEGVLTAVLAWFVFREQFDRRIFIGMVLIVAAGVLLSWEPGSDSELSWGSLYVIGACLCWAIDNNLTRKISASDAMQIAAVKGLAAGSVNLLIALLWLRSPLPPATGIAGAALVGFAGYGLSLVLFVLALRGLGTARTGAYFSTAPFVGAGISLMLLGEQPAMLFWVAAALMAAGIWLHITERHKHEHHHERMHHSHSHRHDAHHQHEHDFPWDGTEPHVHPHEHEPVIHSHPHFPDIHHRHSH